MEMPNEIELSLVKNFRMSIWSRFQKSIRDYDMIRSGDRVAVCVSGGMDSMLLAECMKRYQRYSKITFETEYIFLDNGRDTDSRTNISDIAPRLEIPVKTFDVQIADTESLYRAAQELGCNKIALGNHLDDVIETILTGLLFGSKIGTMMPKERSDTFDEMQLIRPLYTVREEDIAKWFGHNGLTFKAKDNDISPERQEVRALLASLRAVSPAIDMNIFRSVENVNLQTLISYRIGDEQHHFLDSYDEGRSVRGTVKSDT